MAVFWLLLVLSSIEPFIYADVLETIWQMWTIKTINIVYLCYDADMINMINKPVQHVRTANVQRRVANWDFIINAKYCVIFMFNCYLCLDNIHC